MAGLICYLLYISPKRYKNISSKILPSEQGTQFYMNKEPTIQKSTQN